MNFVKIELGNTVFDTAQLIKGTVKSIDYKTNKAELVISSSPNGEITTSNLFNLITVGKELTDAHDPNKWWNWVREFQLTFGHPAPGKPTMLTEQRIKERNAYMYEECEEMLEAKTLEDQVDAALDQLYFALGNLVELGVKPDRLLEIVQKANMGKLHNVNGKMVPVYNEVGKVKKPDDWEEKYAPEEKLKEEIERQFKS